MHLWDIVDAKMIGPVHRYEGKPKRRLWKATGHAAPLYPTMLLTNLSAQFGHASAPKWPHHSQRIRGPCHGTGTSSP